MHPTTQALLDYMRAVRIAHPHACDSRAEAEWRDAGFPDASQPKNGPHVVAVGPHGANIEMWRNGEIVSTSQLVWRRFGRYAVIEHWRSESAFIGNLRVIVGQTDPAGGAQISWLDPTTGTTRPSAAEWLVHPSTLELL